MKELKYIICIIAILLPYSLWAQKDAKTREVLDQTVALFNKAGGIRATFQMQNYQGNRQQDNIHGTILLKGNKFQLKTAEMNCWFNGKTQWTYIANTDEVNISNPTNEELQQINPYLFLNLYKHGFNYKFGKGNTWKGKSIYVVELTPEKENKNEDLKSITVFINRKDYQPLFIKMVNRSKSQSLITIDSFQKNQNLPESTFVFNKKSYPNVDIIDLR